MLNTLQKIRDEKAQNNQKGFTIIEVMIVLAIAGLILLIVFLAVPALQRNSRNTQRKTDVANTAAEINNYVSNNGGVLPTSAKFGEVTSNVKFGYFPAASVSYSATFVATNTNAETVLFVPNAKCSDSTTATNAGARQGVLLYGVENKGSTGTSQCQEI